jgi:DNA-binding LytR/AlgR family response regulator
MDIVIIEDEELAARRFDPGIKILAKLESIEEAVNWFRAHPEPDLIFLDIHLEDGLSFQIFDKVPVRSPIIFTTAFDEYAIKAFKLKSIDYLLKPITQEDLNTAIIKYKDWNASSKSVIGEVAYFYSVEGMTFLVCRDKSEYPIDNSLDKLNEELSPKDFFRINRQFIVGMKSIGNIHVYPKSRLKLELYPSTRIEVFVSIDKVVKFKEWLNS